MGREKGSDDRVFAAQAVPADGIGAGAGGGDAAGGMSAGSVDVKGTGRPRSVRSGACLRLMREMISLSQVTSVR